VVEKPFEVIKEIYLNRGYKRGTKKTHNEDLADPDAK
jgi:hypothetical protein